MDYNRPLAFYVYLLSKFTRDKTCNFSAQHKKFSNCNISQEEKRAAAFLPFSLSPALTAASTPVWTPLRMLLNRLLSFFSVAAVDCCCCCCCPRLLLAPLLVPAAALLAMVQSADDSTTTHGFAFLGIQYYPRTTVLPFPAVYCPERSEVVSPFASLVLVLCSLSRSPLVQLLLTTT